MRIAMCQLNVVVGSLAKNARQISDAIERAAALDADIALVPELAVCGYPPEDLLLKEHFVRRCEDHIARIHALAEIPAIVGGPARIDGALYNAAWVVGVGDAPMAVTKQHLPNYAVFDERRWFTPGTDDVVVELPLRNGQMARVLVTICEDLWVDEGPVARTANVDLVANISASPWRIGREHDRESLIRRRAQQAGSWIALCNQVGAQDELVFDGSSLVAAPDGSLVHRSHSFEEHIAIVDTAVQPTDIGAQRTLAAERVWQALTMGIRDYVCKNGFSRVILGMSGGIDSAVVAALAVDALGDDAVDAMTMPSRFTSGETRTDANKQAGVLGIRIDEVSIEPIVNAFHDVLGSSGAVAKLEGVAAENLQARIRGTLLMARSNSEGHLVLATGNKSEYSVGYATLYGDMNGGFAPLKDVPKMLVYELAQWRNDIAATRGEAIPIPTSVIERPPTAELRADQRDADSLPAYDVLDPLLDLLVGRDRGVEEAIAAGYDEADVLRIQSLIDRAEYKRRQAPPGVRVTAKAFGRDRRVPITNQFDGRVSER